MKAMKKLIPAICLLLISAVLLGTSTYAWFSMNQQVTATGMQVQATTPASVEISQSTDSGWAFTTTFADPNPANVLTPTYYDAASKKFYIPTAANVIKVDGSVSTSFSSTDTTNWKALTIGEDGKADNIQYLAVYTLYLRTNVGTATGGTAVALKCSLAKEGDSKLEEGVSVGIMNTTDNSVTELSATASTETWTAALSTSTPGYTTIKVVIWYNGQNTAVKNDNADSVVTKINLTFTAATGTGA